jgi:hypothetical protein
MSRSLFCVAVCLALLLCSGCETAPTPEQCNLTADPEQRIDCLDKSMFADVAHGTATGAVTGAVLGGAVAFAMSKGHSLGALGRGVLAGGMVGGVAGGAAAYMADLRARTNNDLSRMREENAADAHRDNEEFELLTAAVRDLAQSIEGDAAQHAGDAATLRRQLDDMDRKIAMIDMAVRKTLQTAAVRRSILAPLHAEHDGQTQVESQLAEQYVQSMQREIRKLKADRDSMRQLLEGATAK